NYAQWQLLDSCTTSGGTNQVPSVTLTSPLATAQVKVGDVVTLAANASDTDGTVARVEFSVDGVLVGQATQAPYTASWTATAGAHEFSAVAFDDKGAVSTKNAVTLTVAGDGPVNQAPSVSVALSAATVDVGAVVTLTADAADADGSVDKVDFYVGGALVGTSAQAPYTLNYTTTKAGSLAVYARATDNLGATTDSALATLVVNGVAPVASCRPDGLYQTEGVQV
ncbi:chitinase, partial [Vibrio cholerae]|nr:chitinase [Vibrio cholerae]